MKCTVCNSVFESESPSILVMGAYGNPKYLCEECAKDLDAATIGTDIDEIGAAMERIGKKMSNSNPDKHTYTTVNSILAGAADRAKKIRDGEYDFASDEDIAEGDGGFDELPEDLKETEEDRELDRKDEEKARKVNKFMDYVTYGAIAGVVVGIIFIILQRFVF